MNDSENLKKQLQQTQLAYQSVLEMSQFKSQYLGKIAHELRSPLSSLMSLQQMIIFDLCENEEEQKEFMAKAYEYTQKLMGLMDQLIEISQIESARIKLDLKPLSLAEILAQVYNRTHLQAANRNLQLVFPEINSNLYAIADEQKLLQSLVNLIDATITSADSGSIIITVSNFSEEKLLSINIDAPVVMKRSSDSTPLTTPPPPDIIKNTSPPQFSVGMKMMLSKTLLETMKGQLLIQELSPQNPTNSLTRLQCLLPLASPPAVTQ